MPSVIHQPHDKFFKLSLSELRVAKEFFCEHLPATVLEKLNIETLKLENHSFIDDNYKGSEADIIYSINISNTKGYLFLLCEHQSTVDRLIAFRLWVYITRLLENHLKQNPGQALPVVYPIIVYTGQEKWDAPLDIFSLFGDQQEFAKECLFKPFQLLDIHQFNDDELLKKRWCGLVEFALKYRRVNDFSQFLKILFPWVREIEKSGAAGFSLSKNVLKYVLNGTEARDFDLFIKGIQEYLSPKLGEEIMTLAQELIQRGQQQGINQGIHQGIHQGEVAVMTRQLKHRFHKVPEFYWTRIEQADAETLLLWSERILDAKTLEEVFAETKV